MQVQKSVLQMAEVRRSKFLPTCAQQGACLGWSIYSHVTGLGLLQQEYYFMNLRTKQSHRLI